LCGLAGGGAHSLHWGHGGACCPGHRERLKHDGSRVNKQLVTKANDDNGLHIEEIF